MPSGKISLAGNKGKSTGQKYQWSPRIGDCNIEAWNCSYLTLRWAHFKAFLCKLYILSTLATTFGLLATLVTEKSHVLVCVDFKRIVKRAEPHKCDIRVISRILSHTRITPCLKEWRI